MAIALGIGDGIVVLWQNRNQPGDTIAQVQVNSQGSLCEAIMVKGDLISFPQIHQDIYIWRGTQLRFSSVDVLALFPLSWVGLEYAIMIEWQTEILWSSSSSVLIGFEQTNRDPRSHRMALNLTTQPQTVRMGLEWHKATVHDRHLKTISLITAFSSDYDIIFSCPTCKVFWPITALRLRERRGISRCYWTYPWIIRS